MVRPNRRRGGARLSGRAAAGLAHQEGATMRISRLVPALLVVLLLSTSAGAQLNPFGAYYSNIARAAASNDAARVNELVGLGSNPNETDDSGYAGLHYAAMNGNLPMIAVLIKAGARIDQRDRLGNTPLARDAADDRRAARRSRPRPRPAGAGRRSENARLYRSRCGELGRRQPSPRGRRGDPTRARRGQALKPSGPSDHALPGSLAAESGSARNGVGDGGMCLPAEKRRREMPERVL